LQVVNDFINQAEELINLQEYHPVTAVVLAGACLEEFLRNWVLEVTPKENDVKPSIDGYTKILRSQELITKQDVKEITAWAGLRNSAAHGIWSEVSDRDKMIMMLQGVSLFIKRYSH
jgi:uncharacterized protein YutE (UPF0331/DUF86 family)